MKITMRRKKIRTLLALGLTGAGILLTMAAIGTLGIEAQFRSHVNGTLVAGASKEEVIGVITAMNPYVGFPRTLWMLKIANECIEK